MNDYKSIIGRKIRQFRKHRGLTQDTLAEALDIDPKHLCRIECGKNSPSLDLLERIADTLEIKLSQFFDDTMSLSRDDMLENIVSLLNKEDEATIREFYKILITLLVKN